MKQTPILKITVTGAIVFFTGACILALEIVASRILSPAFGSSTFVWGAILAVTMLCLAAGYAWGGNLADLPGLPRKRLPLHIIGAAFWIGLVPVFSREFLLLGIAAGAHLGPIVASFLVLAPPVTLLATSTPLGFGILNQEVETRPGRSVGSLFGISTAGSIAGALAAAYLLIPFLGVRHSCFALSFILLVVASPLLLRSPAVKIALAVPVVLSLIYLVIPDLSFSKSFAEGVWPLERIDSRYSHILVLQDDRNHSRVLIADGTTQNIVSSNRLDTSLIGYIPAILQQTDRYGIGPGNALVIGLGAGTLVRQLESRGFHVDAVEIDPTMLDVARKYFGFQDSDAAVHIQDGRAFLNRAVEENRRYRLIVMDAYHGGRVPAHLYNLNAFRRAGELLSAEGIFAVNLVGYPESPGKLLRHVSATLHAAFRHSEILRIEPGADGPANVLLLAHNRPRFAVVDTDPQYPAITISYESRLLTDDWNPSSRWSSGIEHVWLERVRARYGTGATLPF